MDKDKDRIRELAVDATVAFMKTPKGKEAMMKAVRPKGFVTTKRKCAKEREGKRTVCPDLIECGCFGTTTFGCPNHLGEFLSQDDYGEPLRSNMCKQLNPDGIREGQFADKKRRKC